jgi:hypothetical protein
MFFFIQEEQVKEKERDREKKNVFFFDVLTVPVRNYIWPIK